MGSRISLPFSLLFATLGLMLALAAPSLTAVSPASGQTPVDTATELNMHLLDQVGGTVTAVAVRDGYAYINEGQTLVILDVTDPDKPVEVGRTTSMPANLGSIALQDDYAYAAASEAGLRVVDIFDPAAPVEVGHLLVGDTTWDVDVAGEFAYVLSDAGIHVVDISQPAQPTQVSFYSIPACSWSCFSDLDVADGHIYLAGPGPMLRILSLANPALPMLVGSFDTGWATDSVAVVGNYAYLAINEFSCQFQDCWTTSELQVIDVTDKSAPQHVGIVETVYSLPGLAAGGDRVYIRAGGGIQVIDVAVPKAPVLRGYIDTPGDGPIQIALAGSRVYATDGNSGLRIIDVTDPATLVEIGSHDNSFSATSVALAGQLAVIAAGRDGLQIVEARSPTDHRLIGRLALPGYTRDLAVVNGLAYIADADYGLRVVSLADPADPDMVGALAAPDGAEAVAVSNGLAYVAGATSGLVIMDIRNPGAPVEIGHVDTPGWALDVAVSGHYAYVADYRDGMRIVDVSDPAHPTRIGVLELPPGTAVREVAVVGRYAYLAAGYEGLYIVDISDPRAPKEVVSYELREAIAVTVNEEFVFVSVRNGGVHVFDVSDPAAPSEVAFYGQWDNIENVTVTGDVVYAANGSSGLLVIQHWGPHTLSGRVTLTDGTPLSGAWVQAGARRAQTDDGGSYTLNRLQPGAYTVQAVAAGYGFAPSVQQVKLPPDGAGVDFTAAAWAGIWSTKLPLAAAP